jgi:aminoglycoside phosphotransferase (APT) family kinase protein
MTSSGRDTAPAVNGWRGAVAARESTSVADEVEAELVLTSGTTSGVVKIGETVRRPVGPWTDTIDALLRHLRHQRFPAPRPLGRDAQGRQVLSWVEGETTWDEHAKYWSDLNNLRGVGRLVRRLHDALDAFVPRADCVWPEGWGGTAAHGAICHRDLGAYNVVWTPDGRLAVIDWDRARPGDRLMELAYVIDSFALLRRDATATRLGYTSPLPRARRVEAIWVGYGHPDQLRPVLAEALVANARDRAVFG